MQRPGRSSAGSKITVRCATGSAVHLCSDFRSEVFLLLLDALASLKANSVNELDLAAELLGRGVDVLLDRDAAILDERLLQEAVFFVELVQLAGSDLFLDLLGLAGHLGIVVHLRDEDLLFFLDDVVGQCRPRPRG